MAWKTFELDKKLRLKINYQESNGVVEDLCVFVVSEDGKNDVEITDAFHADGIQHLFELAQRFESHEPAKSLAKW